MVVLATTRKASTAVRTFPSAVVLLMPIYGSWMAPTTSTSDRTARSWFIPLLTLLRSSRSCGIAIALDSAERLRRLRWRPRQEGQNLFLRIGGMEPADRGESAKCSCPHALAAHRG